MFLFADTVLNSPFIYKKTIGDILMHAWLDGHPTLVFSLIAGFLILIAYSPMQAGKTANEKGDDFSLRYGLFLRLAGILGLIFFGLVAISILQDTPTKKVGQNMLGCVLMFFMALAFCLHINLFHVACNRSSLSIRTWLRRKRIILWSEIASGSIHARGLTLTLTDGRRIQFNNYMDGLHALKKRLTQEGVLKTLTT